MDFGEARGDGVAAGVGEEEASGCCEVAVEALEDPYCRMAPAMLASSRSIPNAIPSGPTALAMSAVIAPVPQPTSRMSIPGRRSLARCRWSRCKVRRFRIRGSERCDCWPIFSFMIPYETVSDSVARNRQRTPRRITSGWRVSRDPFENKGSPGEPYETGALLPMQQIHPLLGSVMT